MSLIGDIGEVGQVGYSEVFGDAGDAGSVGWPIVAGDAGSEGVAADVPHESSGSEDSGVPRPRKLSGNMGEDTVGIGGRGFMRIDGGGFWRGVGRKDGTWAPRRGVEANECRDGRRRCPF